MTSCYYIVCISNWLVNTHCMMIAVREAGEYTSSNTWHCRAEALTLALSCDIRHTPPDVVGVGEAEAFCPNDSVVSE